MNEELRRIYQNKTYIFRWGSGHLTFSQLIDGSKAAWCQDDDRCYWLYFDEDDTELTMPRTFLEMSVGEEEELEYHDIICDLSGANNRGMYPEVSDQIRQILVERSVRRETVFALNRLDASLIKCKKGLVYLTSRQAMELYKSGMELQTAVGEAIGSIMLSL